MSSVAMGLVLILAAQHLFIMIAEMFLWTTPKVRKAFGMSEQQAEATRVLAANQGLYNGFLAAGLLWAFWAEPALGRPLALFFAGCVLAAGLYGAMTANRRILFVQALPAALTIAAILFTA